MYKTQGGAYYQLCFTDEDFGAQKDEEICSWSHSYEVVELEFESEEAGKLECCEQQIKTFLAEGTMGQRGLKGPGFGGWKASGDRREVA